MPGAGPPAKFKPVVGIAKHGWVGVAIVCFAAFGGFLYGYDTGYISGTKAMPFWLREFGTRQPDGTYALSTADDSLVTSILSVGTCIGALVGYPSGDIMGRRMGIVFGMSWFCLGVALQVASTEIGLFSAGRVFAGLGVGMVSVLVPLYQSECAPKEIRGAVVACYQWAITIGLLAAACVVQGTKDINGFSSYRVPISLQFVWAAILAGGCLLLPESPRWFMLKGREEEARRSMARLRSAPIDSEVVMSELNEIKEALESEMSVGTSWFDCLRPSEKRLQKTATGMGLQALQQLTGINFIFYYGTTFFASAGVTNPFIATIATNVVNVGMTVPGILGVDYFGRRPLLLVGAASMLICEWVIAIVGVTVGTSNASASKVLIGFSCIYVGSFAATWGPLAWVVTSEMFPLAIRAKALALSTLANWLLNFAIGYATPYMVDAINYHVFMVWGSCCILCFLFTFFCIPETKGLSLEQVEQLWAHSTVLGSTSYRRQLIEESQSHQVADGAANDSIAEKKASDRGETQHV